MWRQCPAGRKSQCFRREVAMTLVTVPRGFENDVKDTGKGQVREAVNTVKHLYR